MAALAAQDFNTTASHQSAVEQALLQQVTQYISQYTPEPRIISYAPNASGDVMGKFASQGRVFSFRLSTKGLVYKPVVQRKDNESDQDFALRFDTGSDILLEQYYRLDAAKAYKPKPTVSIPATGKAHGTKQNPKCGVTSYHCGVCISLGKNCIKNATTAALKERLTKINSLSSMAARGEAVPRVKTGVIGARVDPKSLIKKAQAQARELGSKNKTSTNPQKLLSVKVEGKRVSIPRGIEIVAVKDWHIQSQIAGQSAYRIAPKNGSENDYIRETQKGNYAPVLKFKTPEQALRFAEKLNKAAAREEKNNPAPTPKQSTRDRQAALRAAAEPNKTTTLATPYALTAQAQKRLERGESVSDYDTYHVKKEGYKYRVTDPKKFEDDGKLVDKAGLAAHMKELESRPRGTKASGSMNPAIPMSKDPDTMLRALRNGRLIGDAKQGYEIQEHPTEKGSYLMTTMPNKNGDYSGVMSRKELVDFVKGGGDASRFNKASTPDQQVAELNNKIKALTSKKEMSHAERERVADLVDQRQEILNTKKESNYVPLSTTKGMSSDRTSQPLSRKVFKVDSVDLEGIHTKVPASAFNKQELSHYADLMINSGGTASPIILKQHSPISFEVLRGHKEYHAALEAQKKNSHFEAIDAFIVRNDNEANAATKQYDSLNKGNSTGVSISDVPVAKNPKKITKSSIDLEGIRSALPRNNFSEQHLDQTRKALEEVGDTFKPILVKQSGGDRYEVLRGHDQFYAALEAQKRNPSFEAINAYIVPKDQEKAVLAQYDAVNGGEPKKKESNYVPLSTTKGMSSDRIKGNRNANQIAIDRTKKDVANATTQINKLDENIKKLKAGSGVMSEADLKRVAKLEANKADFVAQREGHKDRLNKLTKANETEPKSLTTAIADGSIKDATVQGQKVKNAVKSGDDFKVTLADGTRATVAGETAVEPKLSPAYSLNKARYAKNKMAIKVQDSSGGMKGNASYLAEYYGGKYSNREKAYIISPSAAKKFEEAMVYAAKPKHERTYAQHQMADPRFKLYDKQAKDRTGEELAEHKQWHKQAVATALSEGKSVPAEVLKDYPDLKADKPVEPRLAQTDLFGNPVAIPETPAVTVTATPKAKKQASSKVDVFTPEMKAHAEKVLKDAERGVKDLGLSPTDANAFRSNDYSRLSDKYTTITPSQITDEGKKWLKENENKYSQSDIDKAYETRKQANSLDYQSRQTGNREEKARLREKSNRLYQEANDVIRHAETVNKLTGFGKSSNEAKYNGVYGQGLPVGFNFISQPKPVLNEKGIEAQKQLQELENSKPITIDLTQFGGGKYEVKPTPEAIKTFREVLAKAKTQTDANFKSSGGGLSKATEKEYQTALANGQIDKATYDLLVGNSVKEFPDTIKLQHGLKGKGAFASVNAKKVGNYAIHQKFSGVTDDDEAITSPKEYTLTHLASGMKLKGTDDMGETKTPLKVKKARLEAFATELSKRIPDIDADNLTSEQKKNISEAMKELTDKAKRGDYDPRKDSADLYHVRIPNSILVSRTDSNNITHLNPKDIDVDTKRFQYKIKGAKTTGTVGSLRGLDTWDAKKAGVMQVWKDPADDKTYIVNGHNRLQKAKQLGAEKVAVRYLDVPSHQEAKAVGALTNIAEGSGTDMDSAKFFADMKKANFSKGQKARINKNVAMHVSRTDACGCVETTDSDRILTYVTDNSGNMMGIVQMHGVKYRFLKPVYGDTVLTPVSETNLAYLFDMAPDLSLPNPNRDMVYLLESSINADSLKKKPVISRSFS